MSIWLDWVVPALVLLMLIAALANMVVSTRSRRRAEAALTGAVNAAAAGVKTADQVSAAAKRLEDRALEVLAEQHDSIPVTVVYAPGPIRHSPPVVPADVPEACAVNEHDWSSPEVMNLRVHPAGADGERLLCSVSWRCAGCGASRLEQRVPPPVPIAVAGPGIVPPPPTVAETSTDRVAGPGCTGGLPVPAVQR